MDCRIEAANRNAALLQFEQNTFDIVGPRRFWIFGEIRD